MLSETRHGQRVKLLSAEKDRRWGECMQSI